MLTSAGLLAHHHPQESEEQREILCSTAKPAGEKIVRDIRQVTRSISATLLFVIERSSAPEFFGLAASATGPTLDASCCDLMRPMAK